MSTALPRKNRRIPVILTDAFDVPVAAEISVSEHVLDVATILHESLAFKRIHEKYPQLLIGELVAAMRLAVLASREPGGAA